jgi:hypothetical protein
MCLHAVLLKCLAVQSNLLESEIYNAGLSAGVNWQSLCKDPLQSRINQDQHQRIAFNIKLEVQLSHVIRYQTTQMIQAQFQT